MLLYVLIAAYFWHVAHFLADFMAQTETMALNKSKSNKWLFYHVATYTGVMGVAASMFWFAAECVFSFWYVIVFTLLTFCLHFATDYCTSRAVAKEHAKGNTRGIFQVVGFDQMLHHIGAVATGLGLFAVYTHFNG